MWYVVYLKVALAEQYSIPNHCAPKHLHRGWDLVRTMTKRPPLEKRGACPQLLLDRKKVGPKCESNRIRLRRKNTKIGDDTMNSDTDSSDDAVIQMPTGLRRKTKQTTRRSKMLIKGFKHNRLCLVKYTGASAGTAGAYSGAAGAHVDLCSTKSEMPHDPGLDRLEKAVRELLAKNNKLTKQNEELTEETIKLREENVKLILENANVQKRSTELTDENQMLLQETLDMQLKKC